MSNERDDLRNVELGTSAENDMVDDVEVDDTPDGLPPRENVVPDSDQDKDENAAEFDDDKLHGSIVAGDRMQYDEDEEKNKRRNKLAIVAIVLILLFALLLALGLIYAQGDDQLQSLIVQTPAPTSQTETTPAPVGHEPTPFPTDAPILATKSPTTRSPTVSGAVTQSPTAAPFAPTFGGPRSISALPCLEISKQEEVLEGNFGENNFEIYTLDHGVQVCGDTYAGFDPDHINRNLWQATIGRRNCVEQTFQEGTETCENVSARRCTADELAQHAAQGSGCGGDVFMLYTSTTCTVNSLKGYLKINIDFRERGMPFFECEPNFNTVKTLTRCCGDIYE